MSFFSKDREALRSKMGDERDEFCAHLQSIGIEAQMAPRGRAEEGIARSRRRSLGVIDIVEGPIRWVNVTIQTAPNYLDTTWGDEGYYLMYGVPDPKVRSGFPAVRLEAKSVYESVPDRRWWFLKFPVLGPVIGVRWEGNDLGLGIVQHLNQNAAADRALQEIWAWRDLSCWILTVAEVLAPSKQEWDCYQSIASHLLWTPLPPNA